MKDNQKNPSGSLVEFAKHYWQTKIADGTFRDIDKHLLAQMQIISDIIDNGGDIMLVNGRYGKRILMESTHAYLEQQLNKLPDFLKSTHIDFSGQRVSPVVDHLIPPNMVTIGHGTIKDDDNDFFKKMFIESYKSMENLKFIEHWQEKPNESDDWNQIPPPIPELKTPETAFVPETPRRSQEEGT